MLCETSDNSMPLNSVLYLLQCHHTICYIGTIKDSRILHYTYYTSYIYYFVYTQAQSTRLLPLMSSVAGLDSITPLLLIALHV